MSDHGAFAEWFHKTIKSVEDCEKEELCFVDVMKEWCKDNNHEWTRQGVFHNDIGVAESSVDDEDLDCCVFCNKSFDLRKSCNQDPNEYQIYFETPNMDDGDCCPDCLIKIICGVLSFLKNNLTRHHDDRIQH